ncbi:aspartate/glutamate racemase family protein [Bradyrhizobium sp. LHD-71]|uniref:maleate cis-trans isomerase family protein n=1 Tax=Bradyrhizobium sp. LHD-71 TaxID=3072141 RepID=UPI0028108919|nr:aspartate/glutamate racemase family protein [Bradyrhizobium sp. LHD-71]MDQ8730879.1 aspartate/glutamate racemase family protein [Bradyrhizobium sp. LHD-71]
MPLKAARLGMLTPSSNTVLEPMLMHMMRDCPATTVHFSRFKVTEIALSRSALDQFAANTMLQAAELLAHAKVDVIAWNGTSASWTGLESDRQLCRDIEAATGIPATSSVLALDEIMRSVGLRNVGLVTPYTRDVQDKIITNLEAGGFRCTSERCLELSDNFSFAEVTEEAIEGLVTAVAAKGCDAVAIVCTNMRGARIAARLEKQLGIPVYDSVAVTLWKSMRLAGAAMSGLREWGSLFSSETEASAAAHAATARRS